MEALALLLAEDGLLGLIFGILEILGSPSLSSDGFYDPCFQDGPLGLKGSLVYTPAWAL